MVRITQAVVFFALLGAGVLVWAPYSDGPKLFGVILAGSLVAAMLVYVLPWVYFDLDDTPTSGPNDG